MLEEWPDLAPTRPPGSIETTLSDAELLTMAVMPALLGFTSERRRLRYVNAYLAGMFPSRIGQSGYNKRLRKAPFLFIRVIRMLAMDTSLWSDDVWVVDATPVECGRSRETVTRSGARADERETLPGKLEEGEDVVGSRVGAGPPWRSCQAWAGMASVSSSTDSPLASPTASSDRAADS